MTYLELLQTDGVRWLFCLMICVIVATGIATAVIERRVKKR